MSKYQKAIEALAKEGLEMGGRLYALELAKKQGPIYEMLANMGTDDTQEDFKNIAEAIKVLQEAEKKDEAVQTDK